MAYAKFDPNRTHMYQVCKKHKGNISAIAREMNVDRWTIYEFFKKHPKGMALIHEIRGYGKIARIDAALQLYDYSMANYKEDLKTAMQTAHKIMDQIGHEIGWGVENKSNDSPFQSDLDSDNESFNLQAENAKLRKELEQIRNLLKMQKDIDENQ
jgi:hypothetical protein